MGIDWKVHTYADLPSTQLYVRELAEEGLPEGTLVQSLVQKKGQGRQGRVWQSPMGNLYMSFILRPGCTAEKAGQFSFVMAVALAQAIENVLAHGHKLTLKWPNDVLIDGRKCAGILIESILDEAGAVEALVVGIGVNIMAPPEDAVGLNQVSGGRPVPIHPFRDKVLAALDPLYTQWRAQGFGPIRTQWLKRAHGKGQAVTSQIGATRLDGIFKDLDAQGALVLTQKDGTDKLVHAGDVFFAPAPEEG